MPKKTIIGIVEKSPGDPRRVGTVDLQDWFQQCWITVQKYRHAPDTEIWVVSATHLKGCKPATQYYEEVFKSFDLEIHTKPVGYETIGQLREYASIASQKRANLTLVVTETHVKRVEWMCKREGISASFVVAKGTPNPREKWTDPILTIAYPIMDKLGLLVPFLKWTVKRRQNGKL